METHTYRLVTATYNVVYRGRTRSEAHAEARREGVPGVLERMAREGVWLAERMLG